MAEENSYPTLSENKDPAPSPATPAGAMQNYAADASGAVADTTREMSTMVAHLTEMARADAAVGAAQTSGGHTFVPLASVSVQAGFGLGFGGGGGGDSSNQGSGGGGGGGGGGRSSSRVIAIADISDDGVRVQPVPDVTRIALGFMALMALGMLRGRRGSGRRFFGLIRRS
ncbi:MAG TPA: hypothetical protein VH951_04805 [Dehalococcoidia bacterium]|jgi:uncharacterized spore protein YtfJ